MKIKLIAFAILLVGIGLSSIPTTNLSNTYIYYKSLLLNGKNIEIQGGERELPKNWVIYGYKEGETFLVNYSSPTSTYLLKSLTSKEFGNFSQLFSNYDRKEIKGCNKIYQIEGELYYLNEQSRTLVIFEDLANSNISDLCKWLEK